jgi:hypothetical protein
MKCFTVLVNCITLAASLKISLVSGSNVCIALIKANWCYSDAARFITREFNRAKNPVNPTSVFSTVKRSGKTRLEIVAEYGDNLPVIIVIFRLSPYLTVLNLTSPFFNNPSPFLIMVLLNYLSYKITM